MDNGAVADFFVLRPARRFLAEALEIGGHLVERPD
ncbi:hypothetical protein F4559_001606 [Saccharothrix violaceirubra]|uniref:Uncharacterized protein n=1 Tax=Saccharothrix violaceirubra TaxID=413306 RepID=A0A7W7WUV9_9PSEU|nr:hypothetical protein [Saccharothrix violaceirubra]